MPELPEVETVRRGLAPFMEGQVIRDVELRRPNLRYAFPLDFASRLLGQRIIALKRRAKYLLIECEKDTILSHLGMSGSFKVEEALIGDFHHPRGMHKHDHVFFKLENGVSVTYNDPRRFGFMLFLEDGFSPFLANLGVEPLSNGLSSGYLLEALGGKKVTLKAALMNQEIIAGLGNIYVCEALFLAKLSPFMLAFEVKEASLMRLVDAINVTIEAAIIAGGSTLNDHKQVDGTLGYFQHRFKVYDREGKACTTCQSIIKREVQNGRSTFYCEKCQGEIK